MATVPKESGQTGIGEARAAADGTLGWLVEFRAENVSYPIAGKLILWRAGKIIRRFSTQQAFYSWAFYAEGKQVAYHTGPLHGEPQSHCELHDARSGRLLAIWDGDLQAEERPPWTKALSH